MAPRKNKTQGKRNNVKIKSKGNNTKKGLKPVKKTEPVEKPLSGLKWLNDLAGAGPVKKCEVVPEWLEDGAYKNQLATDVSDTNTSEYDEYQRLEDKSTSSDASEECNCPTSNYSETNKSGILKAQISSTNSLVSKYIQSGMNQVASFIVESAIRFGEEHGVVVPDKDTPNLYEITPPEGKIADKIRKIRFKVPEKALDYDMVKKSGWRHYRDSQACWKRAQTPMPEWKMKNPTKSSSWNSTADSLEEILPILEKLKQGGDIVDSDLDLEKLRKSETEESDRTEDRERDWARDRDRERDRERDRDRERGREREREREKDRGRERDRDRDRDRSRVGNKERLKEKLRTLRKRYKNLGATSLKKGRRDSLELGRQRMRAAAGTRKPEMASLTPY